YFVQVSNDVAYWQHRFHCAAVDLHRSYGAFAGDELVAFIIQGFCAPDAVPTAFNSGTGVLPAYRGQQLVDRLYAHALPLLRHEGITCCTLEVIQQNERAIRVYERIGFRRMHAWRCFRGELAPPARTVALLPIDRSRLDPIWLSDDHLYSWDHRWPALERSDGRWMMYAAEDVVGYVVLDPVTGRIARIGVQDEEDAAQWNTLMAGVCGLVRNVSIVNVHQRRTGLVAALLAAGLVEHVDQFEMRMELA
ncbi:MAG TPA: GNAT family N-acetyltransferase, partial [Flavobacteriales bacterium]|nr:GNAT family N-acetyltransferase [Flavobacteriales bacterium]